MKIKTKIESIEVIKKMELNILPEIFFDGFDEQKLKSFLTKYKAEFYAIRDKTVAASPKHKLAVKSEDVIDYCKDNALNKFTVNVSSYNYRENQICVGEICIYDDTVDYIISNNPNFSLRDCYENYDYRGTLSLFDKKIKNIKGLKNIIDYAFENELIGIIIEFSLFNCLVGIKNENIVIWELRTDY